MADTHTGDTKVVDAEKLENGRPGTAPTESSTKEYIPEKTTAEQTYDKPTYVEEIDEKPKKRRRCTPLCLCGCFVILVVVVLVVALPLVFVGIPRIGQKDINKSTLEITKQVVTNAKPDSVDIELATTARSFSKFHPTLGEFEAALYLESTLPDIKPFGYVTIPEATAKGEFNIDIKQNLKIADLDQFKEYNKLVIQSESFKIGVRGRVPVKLGKLRPFTADYDKIVELKGLNGLAGFSIQSFELVIPAEADGVNMIGKVFIPNPSVLTVEMGNVTMDLSVDGKAIGKALLPNMTLRPGDNVLDMRTTADLGAVIGVVTSGHLNGVLPVDIIGNSSINSAGEHLEYFEAAIQSAPLSAELNVLAAIDLQKLLANAGSLDLGGLNIGDLLGGLLG